MQKKKNESAFGSFFLRMPLGGAKSAQECALTSLLQSVSLVFMADRYVWSLTSSGDFPVGFAHAFLDTYILPLAFVATRWVSCVALRLNLSSGEPLNSFP